jgi:transglutaminase-like putative cysteine protease
MKKIYRSILSLAMVLTIIAFTACSMDSMDPTPEPDVPTDLPFEVKAEITIFDGSTLEFSEKPVRAQWGISDDLLYKIAFVFPKNTKIRQRLNGSLIPIYAVSEYQAVNRIFPQKDYGKSAYEIILTDVMGKEAYGIRVISTHMGRGLLPIYIDGLTERAVNPGNSIIYVWDIDPSKPKPTDDNTLAYFRLPSRDIQSDDKEIAALAKTITNGINSDYEKTRAIHLWVAGNIWYNFDWLNGVKDKDAVRLNGEESWSSTYVLRNKRGVCGGYANLTVALLRAAVIPANSISGSAGGDAHAWTEAYVDNRWINMDSTWDSKNRYENGKFSPKQDPGSSWFDVPDKEFSKTHIRTSYADYILKNGLAATKAQ